MRSNSSGSVRYGFEQARAGVIDQDVDAPKTFIRQRNQLLYLFELRYIGNESGGLAPR
jgi:hypothetical protein